MTTRKTYKRLDVMTPVPSASGGKLLYDNTKIIDDVLDAIPKGGIAGQVLKKVSNNSYDTYWGAPEATVIIVDTLLSTTSVNPVRNSIVTTAINGKANINHTHVLSNVVDFPVLATVATSGSYNDLSNTPLIDTALNAESVNLVQNAAVTTAINALDTAEVILSGSTITQAVSNNTIYIATETEVTSLTITAATGLEYAGFDFLSGTSMTLTAPSTWIFEGADCDSGVFMPTDATRYRMAIDKGFGVFVCTIQKVTILE